MHVKMLSRRALFTVLAAATATFAGTASALEFSIADNPLKIDNLFTIGGQWRTQEPDDSIIGKSTLYARTHPGRTGLCFTRTSGTADSSPNSFATDDPRGANTLTAGVIPRGCTNSAPTPPSGTSSTENVDYVSRPGSFNPNADNSDLNFGKGDLVAATAKLTTDFTFSMYEYNLFVRTIVMFDENYTSFQETRPDTTLQARKYELAKVTERDVGFNFKLLDYNLSHVFSVADHDLNVKIGNQVLNWGESSLLALNSLNSINPPDARRLNVPGADLKEAFRPIGMITGDTQVIEGLTVQGFYSYDWKPIMIDPVGSFWSQSDTLGDGGDFAMLSFAKQPDDPGFATSDPRYVTGKRGYYRPIDTCSSAASCTDSLGLLGSTASRTIFRDHAAEKAREPKGGDYGLALKTFLESINNGTELALYYANYDSRLPVVSAFAAQRTCIQTAADMGPGGACGYNGPGAAATGTSDPVPVDTARLLVEYPKDVHMMGLSFNTTVGDYALSGEYAYRSNLPVQIDTVDLTYSALMPAFDDQDVSLGAVTIPGRQSAFPAFLPVYRGMPCTTDANCIQPGQYIPGYERLKVGQANLTVLRLIGGDNPLAASQMTLLLEMGAQRVFNMPALGQLQLEGTGSDTHISNGADGTTGIEPPMAPGNSRTNFLRQNPTANKDYLGYGTSESYGYRFVNLNRWDNALFGANLETLFIFRHDVKGTSPGIGTNFSQGRKQANFGLRFDYLSTYIGEIRYSWLFGGGHHDNQRDRDNVFVTVGYQF